jgi:hypothetical protein
MESVRGVMRWDKSLIRLRFVGFDSKRWLRWRVK